MAKTTVDIDREAAAEAAEILGTTTLRETVNESLREAIDIKRRQRFFAKLVSDPERFDSSTRDFCVAVRRQCAGSDPRVAKTTVDIDRASAAEAAESLGTTTLRDTVNVSLLEVIDMKRRRLRFFELLSDPERFDFSVLENEERIEV